MGNNGQKTVRIAALADLHCTVDHKNQLGPLFTQIAEAADIMVLCGDLTDYGLPEEAHVLARELQAVSVPMVAVLGNHDHESGKADDVKDVLCQAGVTILDGDATVIQDVGFTGVKGFAGGFGARALEPWGEPIIKQFVHEAVNEALHLEAGLARLRTASKVVLLHYAPIRATVEGEPLEIFPFLGSSRLEEPINRYDVTLVVHGHAHYGSPQGRTSANIPVYNVSMPLLKKLNPDHPPFRVLEVPIQTAPREAVAV
jgi:Icc-related predicted phosphoesterase